ncbi:hypothetical protein ACFLXI_06750 [Chloroflexota bacterium]
MEKPPSNTDRATHPGTSILLHPHFELFIPIGRAINPITKDNWDVDGIVPDVSVDPQDALDVAYKMALEGVIESL